MTFASEEVRFASGPAEVSAFVCRPRGDGPFPAVVVLHEIFGVVAHIRDLAQRYADEGFVALAPSLYRADRPPREDETRAEVFEAAFAEFPDARGLYDIGAATRYLQSLAGVDARRTGIVGYCMGGRFACMLAALNGAVRAAVGYYFRIGHPLDQRKPVSPLSLAPHVQSACLAIFAESDDVAPPNEIAALRAALAPGSRSEVRVYPGTRHGFFNDTRSNYDAAAAADAWARTLAFLRQHLSPG